MSVTPRRLSQTTLSATIAVVYTTPLSTRTQITEIWIANTSAGTARRVTLRAHGTTITNTLLPSIEVAANTAQIICDSKIVLVSGEVFAAMQDIGTDCVLTMYGVEEAV